MKNAMDEQIDEKSSKTVLDRITIICTVLTIFISSIILAGWLFNLFDISRSNPIYKPTSPGSSLSFIVLGCALVVYFYFPVNHTARKLAKVALGLVLAIDLIILVDIITGRGFDVERFILPHPELVNNAIIGRMSPIAAASFVISGFALILLLFSPDGKQLTKGISAYLASVSLYIGIIVFIGYLYGTPLFYSGTTIQTSLLTAITLIIFSTGLITAAGKEYLPLRLFIGDSVRARLMRSFIPVIIAYIVLEGLLEGVFLGYPEENVLESSVIMIFFFIFGIIITSRIAQTVGGDVDRKNLIQRERAADALRESESKFRAIFETVPEGLGLIRLKDDLLIEANTGILQMFGYARDELIGKNIREQNIWFDPDDKNKMLEQLHSRDFACGLEVKYRKKNGDISIGTYYAAKLLLNDEPHLIISTRDISQRKGLEEELLKNRSLLSSVVEGTSDAIYIKDLKGRYLLFNSASEKFAGKNASQTIGKDDTFLFPSEAAAIIEEDRKVIEAGKVLTYEEVVTSYTGEKHTFLSTKGPLFDASGKPYALFGVARDITDRKRAEKEREVAIINAQNEKNKSDAIIAALGDGIIIQDTNYRITYQNKIQTEIYGEHNGELCYKVYEGRDTICEDCPVEKTFIDGKVHRVERSVPTGGKMSYYELTSSPLRDSSGKIIAGVKMVRDITDRKRAEEKIREGEQFLESIFESIQDGICIIDMEMNIIKVNKTAEIWYPHAVPLIGKKCYEAYHNRKERCELCPAHETFRTGNCAHQVVSKHGPGGKKVGWHEIYSFPLRDTTRGQIIGVIEYVRDITQRKVAEAERVQLIEREQKALVQVEAAQKLDLMKSIFIASTSHELRTPLNSIIGFTGVLLQGWSGELNKEQKEYLELINSSSKHLLDLIIDILDISKIESGNIDLKVSVFDLREVVDEAVTTLQAIIKEKGLDISVEMEDISMRSDRMRLLQCIMNLVGNSVKYTEKGSIKINAKIIKNNVHISVTDTGIGIKTQDIPRLFAPFVRLESPLTVKTSGTGLGLYLTKKLARDVLSGDIDVESVYGKGSTFTMHLPVEIQK